VVNYALDTPLTTPGEVQAVDNGYSKFEHGTVKSGRHDLHGDWIGGNRLTLTLSGHSHRSGLYSCESNFATGHERKLSTMNICT
jgi:hypothetical protein